MSNTINFGNKVVFANGNAITLASASADPGTASNGDMYYNTTSNVIRAYMNNVWTTIEPNAINALTGDITATGPGSVSATLATVNSNTGSFGSSTAIPNFTVNGKGLITAAGTNTVIAPAGTLTGTTLNSTVVSSSLTSVGTVSSGAWQGTPVGITYGGTGQSTQQGALNAIAGATTSGQYLRGNGTNVQMSAIQSGDVPTLNQNTTGSAGSVSGTNVVTNANLVQTAAHTYLGNNTGSTANVAPITNTQLTADLNQFTSSLQGVVPGSGGGTTNYLRADGTWAAPPAGTGTVTNVGMIVPSILSVTPSSISSSGTFDITYSGTALPVANGGTNSTTSLNNNRFMVSSGGSIVEAGALASSSAVATDSNGLPVASSTTATELGYVHGVTSGIQSQLNATEKTANKGAASGYAPLDSSSKIPVAYLPSVVMEYQQAWNPSTNTPSLSDATGTNGYVYYVSTAYSGTVSGLSDPSMVNFQVGNLIIYSGTAGKWQQAPAASGVVSVNGSQGAVTVNAINQLTSDVTAGPASGSASATATVAAIQGKTVSGTTGTGNVVFSASPTLSGTAVIPAISNTSAISIAANTGSSALNVQASSLSRSTDGTNYVTEVYTDSTTLTDNSSAVSFTTFPIASIAGKEITYVIETGTTSADTRIGVIKVVCSNGASPLTSCADVYTESADCGITWTASVATGTVTVAYTTTNQGANRTMRADVKTFRR